MFMTITDLLSYTVHVIVTIDIPVTGKHIRKGGLLHSAARRPAQPLLGSCSHSAAARRL